MSYVFIFWLTIKAHVLGEGLGQHDIVALFNEVAHRPGITINISTSEALIGHVEEHEQIPLLWGEKERERTKDEDTDRDTTS